MSQRPLFLLSLPRSGSTLLQRMLAVHGEISTAPETWLLLPQIYALREHGSFAEYGQVPASRALKEFVRGLPNGEDDYLAALRVFVSSVYEMASDGPGSYFLDKTPRYYFIVDDLLRLFPDGRFVFLWRHPLAVVASIVQTWGRGRWNLERWRHDLFDGPIKLVEARERVADRVHALRYEDLVADPDGCLRPLFEYLELPYDPAVATSFSSVRLDARMGDKRGSKRYGTLSTEPLEKWMTIVSSPLRKRWCRNYLRHIGRERLAVMGYDLHTLETELDAIPIGFHNLGSDLVVPTASRAARAGRETAARLLWSPGRGSPDSNPAGG